MPLPVRCLLLLRHSQAWQRLGMWSPVAREVRMASTASALGNGRPALRLSVPQGPHRAKQTDAGTRGCQFLPPALPCRALAARPVAGLLTGAEMDMGDPGRAGISEDSTM